MRALRSQELELCKLTPRKIARKKTEEEGMRRMVFCVSQHREASYL